MNFPDQSVELQNIYEPCFPSPFPFLKEMLVLVLVLVQVQVQVQVLHQITASISELASGHQLVDLKAIQSKKRIKDPKKL